MEEVEQLIMENSKTESGFHQYNCLFLISLDCEDSDQSINVYFFLQRTNLSEKMAAD